MVILIDKKRMSDFPAHDALFYSASISQEEKGKTNINFEMQITEDTYEVDYVIPKNKNGITCLVFENTWVVKGEFISDSANRDSFDNIVAVENSKELVVLKKRNKLLNHYRIKLHSGSIVDIICERLFLQKPK